MSITDAPRIRRQAGAVRDDALAAAERLLRSDGPQAITLKAVAGELGMTHANLIHHFGSAGGLRAALVEAMVGRATARVLGAVEELRAGRITARALVDMVFDTFDAGGAGRLVAWMALAGEAERLEPVNRAMRGLVAGIEAGSPLAADEAHRRVSTAALLLTLTALGDALIGPTLHTAVGREPSAARDAIAGLLEALKPKG